MELLHFIVEVGSIAIGWTIGSALMKKKAPKRDLCASESSSHYAQCPALGDPRCDAGNCTKHCSEFCGKRCES